MPCCIRALIIITGNTLSQWPGGIYDSHRVKSHRVENSTRKFWAKHSTGSYRIQAGLKSKNLTGSNNVLEFSPGQQFWAFFLTRVFIGSDLTGSLTQDVLVIVDTWYTIHCSVYKDKCIFRIQILSPVTKCTVKSVLHCPVYKDIQVV